MTAKILDGKALSEEILIECQKKAAVLRPTLAVLLVGDNPASAIYVRNKKKACEKAGIQSLSIEMPTTTTNDDLLKEIDRLNTDPQITGFIVQLPLPEHIDSNIIIRAIDPKKDVDGFHAYNLGKMFLSTAFEDLPPATPAGIIALLEKYNIEISGKEVVVVGHSNIVGKPISMMMLNRDATVTVCHKMTADLASHTRRADILIVAAGVAGLITGEMIKEGATIIDVGINATKKGLVGDVDFESVSQKAGFLSPVPGGIGPMTVASLIRNTIRAAERQKKEREA